MFLLATILTILAAVFSAAIALLSYFGKIKFSITLAILAAVLSIVAGLLFYFDKMKSDEDISNFKRFSNISRLGYYGLEINPGDGLTSNNPLYNQRDFPAALLRG